MNEPDLLYTPGLTPRLAPRIPALGLAGLPSFAHALRKRGLVAPVAHDGEEPWSPVLSVFEAHLKRRAMEQAFAALRGDHG